MAEVRYERRARKCDKQSSSFFDNLALISVLIREPSSELGLKIVARLAHCFRDQPPAQLLAQLLKLLLLIWIDQWLQLFVKRNADLPQPFDLA
jgi:hypothetical protein